MRSPLRRRRAARRATPPTARLLTALRGHAALRPYARPNGAAALTATVAEDALAGYYATPADLRALGAALPDHGRGPGYLRAAVARAVNAQRGRAKGHQRRALQRLVRRWAALCPRRPGAPSYGPYLGGPFGDLGA